MPVEVVGQVGEEALEQMSLRFTEIEPLCFSDSAHFIERTGAVELHLFSLELAVHAYCHFPEKEALLYFVDVRLCDCFDFVVSHYVFVIGQRVS
jgi:hypothetical protein